MQRQVTIRTNTGTVDAAPHWIGKSIAVTAPISGGIATVQRGHWVITHVKTGFSGGSLLCSKKQAIKIAKEWDARFAELNPELTRQWPHCKEWGELVRAINAPWQTPPAESDAGASTETAMFLAAQAKIPVQCEPVAKIQWRGRFWPAPTDAELDQWTFDSVCETPDGRTVEPDNSESWLRILRLV